MFLIQKINGILPSKISSHPHHNPSNCTPLSQYPSPLSSMRFNLRVPADSASAPHLIKSAIRTRMTWIGRIFTDFPIRVNPRHPCDPCSTAASPVAEAPESRNVIYLKSTQIAICVHQRSSAVPFFRKRRRLINHNL